MYKFGRVSYINSLPLFCADIPKNFEIFSAVPSQLNSLAEKGLLDVSLVSRWIYPQICKNYAVIPEYCIGGDGQIISIKLFSRYRLPDLAGKKIYVTSQTGTSSRAFRHVCMIKYGFDLLSDTTGDLKAADAVLLIGNPAMAFAERNFDFSYDLGELWKETVGIPMIYAVYVVKKALYAEIAPQVRNYAERSLKKFQAERAAQISIAQKMFFESQGREISVQTLEKYYDRLIFKFPPDIFERAFNYVSEHGTY